MENSICFVVFLNESFLNRQTFQVLLGCYRNWKEWFTRFWFLFMSSIPSISSISMDSKNIQWCYVKHVLILGPVTPGIGLVKILYTPRFSPLPVDRMFDWNLSDNPKQRCGHPFRIIQFIRKRLYSMMYKFITHPNQESS